MFHLIRHGERQAFTQRSGKWNSIWAENYPDRCWDDGLTELGIQQAQEAAIQLKAEVLNNTNNYYPLKRIITSPFVRCVETGLAMAKVLQVPLYIESAWCEFLFQKWFDPKYIKFNEIFHSIQQLQIKYPNVHIWNESVFTNAVPTQYEIDDEQKTERPKQLAQLIMKHSELLKGTIFVSHGGVIYRTCMAMLANNTDYFYGSGGYCSRISLALTEENKFTITRRSFNSFYYGTKLVSIS